MDTYRLINLNELDKMIERAENHVIDPPIQDEMLFLAFKATQQLYVRRLKEIKELCLKLPSGEDCFNAGVKYGRIMSEGQLEEPISYFEYITQFTKSDKP